VHHFALDQIPRVDALGSMTMYIGRRFYMKNPINHFAIGNCNPLVFNPVKALDLYIQHASPGTDREANGLRELVDWSIHSSKTSNSERD
jgi:hypothetical protein